MTARGIVNNNPGNLEGDIPFRGVVRKDGPYMVFDSAHNGIRAMAIDLHSKWLRGLNTVAKIIPVYAPPNENPTAQYIADVAGWMGVDADAVLNLGVPSTLESMVISMMRQEDGGDPYALADVLAAVDDALGLINSPPAPDHT